MNDHVDVVGCTYCERAAFAARYIKPPLCVKHHEVVLIVSRLRRQKAKVTPETARTMYARQVGKHAITEGELQRLLGDVLEGEGWMS